MRQWCKTMRNPCLLVLSFALDGNLAAQESASAGKPWINGYENAKVLAKKEGRILVLVFP